MLSTLHSTSRRVSREMPPRSEKHKNFRRLAVARTEQVREALRKLSNLSSSNYEYEPDEIDSIFDCIQTDLEIARGKFSRLHKDRKPFSL